MGAAMPPPDCRRHLSAPSRSDGQPDNVLERIIRRRAYGVGAGNGQRFGGMNLHVTIHGHPHLHVMHILVGGDIAAKFGGEGIGLVVGHLRLDVEQPILADKAVAADAAVMHFLARDRLA